MYHRSLFCFNNESISRLHVQDYININIWISLTVPRKTLIVLFISTTSFLLPICKAYSRWPTVRPQAWLYRQISKSSGQLSGSLKLDSIKQTWIMIEEGRMNFNICYFIIITNIAAKNKIIYNIIEYNLSRCVNAQELIVKEKEDIRQQLQSSYVI